MLARPVLLAKFVLIIQGVRDRTNMGAKSKLIWLDALLQRAESKVVTGKSHQRN